MHEKIELIKQALNNAQDAEVKLSGSALEALKDVNEYIFAVEEILQRTEKNYAELEASLSNMVKLNG